MRSKLRKNLKKLRRSVTSVTFDLPLKLSSIAAAIEAGLIEFPEFAGRVETAKSRIARGRAIYYRRYTE